MVNLKYLNDGELNQNLRIRFLALGCGGLWWAASDCAVAGLHRVSDVDASCVGTAVDGWSVSTTALLLSCVVC